MSAEVLAPRDAVAFLVDVATRPAKSVRINIMLPEDLVAQIDRVSRNRSRFLAEAARARLEEKGSSSFLKEEPKNFYPQG